MTHQTPADPGRDEAATALARFWDREDDGGIWEPVTFEVGDRVRLHFSAECRQTWGGEGTFRGHHLAFNDLEGVVTRRLPDDDPWAHHPYAIDFLEPKYCGHCGEFAIGVYAAGSELIAIHDTTGHRAEDGEAR